MKKIFGVVVFVIVIVGSLLGSFWVNYNEMSYLVSYSVNDKTIAWINEDKHTYVNVVYPEFIEINNVTVSNKVNEYIKEKALEQFDDIIVEGINLENIHLYIDYEVMYCNENLVSIKFEGYVGEYKSGHGLNKIYSTNIDLNKEEEVLFESLFNESRNEMFTAYIFKDENGIIADDADLDYITEVFAQFIDRFEYFYFGENEFYIMLPIKDEYEFRAEYEALDGYINWDNEIWDNFDL